MFNTWYINFDVVNKVLFIVYEFIFCSMEERMYWLILPVSISLLRVWAQRISKLKYKVGLLNLKVPMVTNINFLLTFSIDCPGIRL